MGTLQVIQLRVLISAQFSWVREMLPKKQTYVGDFKLNQNQNSANFSNAKGGERDDLSLSREADMGKTGLPQAGYYTRRPL